MFKQITGPQSLIGYLALILNEYEVAFKLALDGCSRDKNVPLKDIAVPLLIKKCPGRTQRFQVFYNKNEGMGTFGGNAYRGCDADKKSGDFILANTG